MATLPRLKPCPTCGTDKHLRLYVYEHGWRHIECDECGYLGPGEGSKMAAVKAHNAKVGTPAAARSEG